MGASRKYISPHSLRAIRAEVRRIVAERKAKGLPPATDQQLAQWLSYDVAAIAAAKRADKADD